MSGQPHPGPPSGERQRPDAVRSGGEGGRSSEGRDLWPRDFGRDGVSGLVGPDRALRARDVSRPTAVDEAAAENVLEELLARAEGRPRPENRSRPGHRPGHGPGAGHGHRPG